SLVYGVCHVLNFSHGTLLTVGGIAAAVLFEKFGLNPFWLILILVPPFFVFGRGFYDLLLAPLERRSRFDAIVGTVMVTVGALIILSDLTAAAAGTAGRSIPLGFHAMEFHGVIISLTQVWILIGVAVLSVILHLILAHTWFGRAVRAVTQDALGATICGIPAASIHSWTFAFGYAIVAVAAVLYTMIYPVDPFMGFSLTVKAFTIIIVGGVGNLPGTLIAGIVLGIAEALTAYFWAPQWAPGLSIVLLLAILVVLPRGLLAKARE
ncbi:MAG: branched-chain amino acid ABC transporter permease, partial [Casimicrobiaceae bacterium]